MNKESFDQFVRLHRQHLPLYFKDFELQQTLTSSAGRKVLQKNYASRLYGTDKCRVGKYFKPIVRIDK